MTGRRYELHRLWKTAARGGENGRTGQQTGDCAEIPAGSRSELRLFRGLVGHRPRTWGSTRVLLWKPFLWYRSAIVLEVVCRQYVAVWARFVLITSVLLFCRFSTLLTRHSSRTIVDRS